MRMISLVIALAIVGGLAVYNKNSLLPGQKDSHQTIKEQSQQILDKTKSAVNKLQQQQDQQKQALDQNSQ